MALNQGNQSPQNNMIASFSFASTVHVTQWSNYLTQQAEILTRRSNLTPQRGKNRSFSLSRNKQIENYPVEKATKLGCYRRLKNKTLLQVLGLCVSSNFRYSSKCFAETYRAQYENAILVYLRGTPIWRPENSVNIWNLL